MEAANAIVIGAGPAGLASAAALEQQGVKAVILEKSATVAPVWRRHYDRLHLHTARDQSALPGLPMPRSYPRYPSRDQVVAYLEQYAEHFALRPRWNREAQTIRRVDGRWHVETAAQSWSAPIVVIATGWADFPYRPSWPGMDAYRGTIVHSSGYRNAAPYAGQRVLVVGFGNSGGEIALDLAEAGIDVTLSVRGPVQILPRDLLGLPILSWAIAQRHLPARLMDIVNAPILRLAIGPVRDLGLRLADKGPRRMVEEDGRAPLLDVGTLARMRDGSIRVRGDIERLTPGGVIFSGHAEERFDGIVLATGFRADLRALLPDVRGVLDGRGMPLVSGRSCAAPGLFFCGLITSLTGQLREIGIEARRIARLALADLAA
jgi:cation diffusion facilitator CzcD-associated flavoprotein CzcO